LFADHSDTVRSFIGVRVSDATLAEDLAAETFLAAAARLQKDPMGPLTIGWLITVARRRIIDHWRSEAAQRQRFARLVWLEQSAHYTETAIGLKVWNALGEVPERQRVALQTRYLCDGSVDDVANAVGCSYASAESLLARGRRSFAAAYG
jgi:RNA polymerase sigma-70 factor (ECF subfamily)